MSHAELVLFTPGPVRVPTLVTQYLADPPCNYHRQDGFRKMFAETEADLKALVGIRDPEAYFATLVTSTGTGANEACLHALAATGKGLILRNGFFGSRLVDQAVQAGIPHAVAEGPNDRPFDPQALDRALSQDRDIRWMYFVAHETRAGLKNPLVEIGQAAKKRGLLVGADVVSAAFAYQIDIEAAQLDLATTSSAKAIMGIPGLGIVFTRVEATRTLGRAKARSYYLDVVAELHKQRQEMQTRFAQPVALHAALRAACIHLTTVGIANHMQRIRRHMDELLRHLEGLGLEAQLDPAYRSWVAVNVGLPKGLQYPEFARRMEAEGYYLLYGIPGDMSHFQISTIGDLKDEHILGIQGAFTRVFGGVSRLPHDR